MLLKKKPEGQALGLKVTSQVNMNLIFRTESKEAMRIFRDEVLTDLSNTVHEALQVTANAVGLDLVMEDSGPDWIRWRIERQ